MMGRNNADEFDDAVAGMSGCVGVTTILGFQTPEEARAFFAGEPNALFDEIEDWLDEEMIDRVIRDRNQYRGTLTVGFACSTDAVHFRLRWCDHLLSA